MNKEFDPMYQAYKEIPSKIFEGKYIPRAAILATAELIYLGQEVNKLPIICVPNNYQTLLLSAISCGMWVSGSILDVHSTLKATKVIMKANELDIDHGYIEQSSLLPDNLTPEIYMHHKKKYLEYGLTLIAGLFPVFGISMGLGRATAGALNNYRVSERLERAIEIKCSEG